MSLAEQVGLSHSKELEIRKLALGSGGQKRRLADKNDPSSLLFEVAPLYMTSLPLTQFFHITTLSVS